MPVAVNTAVMANNLLLPFSPFVLAFISLMRFHKITNLKDSRIKVYYVYIPRYMYIAATLEICEYFIFVIYCFIMRKNDNTLPRMKALLSTCDVT